MNNYLKKLLNIVFNDNMTINQQLNKLHNLFYDFNTYNFNNHKTNYIIFDSLIYSNIFNECDNKYTLFTFNELKYECIYLLSLFEDEDLIFILEYCL